MLKSIRDREDKKLSDMISSYESEKRESLSLSPLDRVSYILDESGSIIGFVDYYLSDRSNLLKCIFILSGSRRRGYASSALKEIFSLFGDWSLRFSSKDKGTLKFFKAVLSNRPYSISKSRDGMIEISFNVNNCGVRY